MLAESFLALVTASLAQDRDFEILQASDFSHLFSNLWRPQRLRGAD
jgi:hypothetical protein